MAYTCGGTSSPTSAASSASTIHDGSPALTIRDRGGSHAESTGRPPFRTTVVGHFPSDQAERDYTARMVTISERLRHEDRERLRRMTP